MAHLLTLVNRTSKTLEGTWDGKHHDLAPGKHAFTAPQCEAFKRQNPIMGSEDIFTQVAQYLLGIEEWGDDCTPIEQSAAIERWDARQLPNAKNRMVVPGHTGVTARTVSTSLPLSTSFTDPSA